MLSVSAKSKGQVQVCGSHRQRMGSGARLWTWRPHQGLTRPAAKPGVFPALTDAGEPSFQIVSGNCSVLETKLAQEARK